MLFQRNDTPTDDLAPPEAPTRDFDPPTDDGVRALYADMRPDQRTAIAGEFTRLFRFSDDPGAQQLDQPITDMLSAEQVAAIHIYARDHLPDVLRQVREHPVTQFALTQPGEPAPPPSKEEQEAMQEAMMMPDREQTAETTPTRQARGAMGEVGADRTGDVFSREHGQVLTPKGETTSGGAEVLERAQEEGPPSDPVNHGPSDTATAEQRGLP